MLDDEAWLFLHEVRLRGVVDPGDGTVVVRLVEQGLVVHAVRGVRVTTAGRDAHTEWARLAPGTDDEAAVRRTYDRFLPLNRELIRICNDWQVRPGGVPNDHRDQEYDWSVIDRLHALHDRAVAMINRVGRVHARFASYAPRLRAAIARVDGGEQEWFTSPRIDSYHTVWMQLHEDVLLAIGVERSSEEDAGQ